jgi:hypothetical protein
MTANRVEAELLIFGNGKSSDGDGRLRLYLRGGRRYRYVPGVADLAMLFVGGVPMPVPGCLHGKEAHGKNQGHRQQSYDYSLRHSSKTQGLPATIVPQMRPERKR